MTILLQDKFKGSDMLEMTGKVKNCAVVEKNIPALRIALTPKCNLSCEYCPPRGENFIVAGKQLLNEKL